MGIRAGREGCHVKPGSLRVNRKVLVYQKPIHAKGRNALEKAEELGAKAYTEGKGTEYVPTMGETADAWLRGWTRAKNAEMGS